MTGPVAVLFLVLFCFSKTLFNFDLFEHTANINTGADAAKMSIVLVFCLCLHT